MKVENRMFTMYKPLESSLAKREIATPKNSIDPLSTDFPEYDLAVSPRSKPELIHPSDLKTEEKRNLSMQRLLLDAVAQSEEIQKNQIHYLYQKQAKLTQDLVKAKKKMMELHKSSDSTLSAWQPTMDIALPLFTSAVSLYLGFSPHYSLSKIAASCTSMIGFAIAGLKIGDIQIPKYIPTSYMTIFNLYMAYINPKNSLAYLITFLQTLPLLSEFAYSIDNNSICSEKALAQKVIQTIDRDLKNVNVEISRVIKMIAQKRKFFSIPTDYAQLQTQIAAIGAV